MQPLYPWLDPAWQELRRYLITKRVPQALLISGPPGLGKIELAKTFAQSILCGREVASYCGECASCRLFHAATHPDFLWVRPGEQGKTITVDVIRNLISELSLKPQYGGRRVVVLAPAHLMNTSAANSLLKTLEEPDERTSLVLVTHLPGALPATVRSRCQRLEVAIPERVLAGAWLRSQGVSESVETLLALARGAPLRALTLGQTDVLSRRLAVFTEWMQLGQGSAEPAALAERWLGSTPLEEITDWMFSWVLDVIRLHGVSQGERVDNHDLVENLKAEVSRLDLDTLFKFIELLLAAKGNMTAQTNRQLMLEELLIHWSSPQFESRRDIFCKS